MNFETERVKPVNCGWLTEPQSFKPSGCPCLRRIRSLVRESLRLFRVYDGNSCSDFHWHAQTLVSGSRPDWAAGFGKASCCRLWTHCSWNLTHQSKMKFGLTRLVLTLSACLPAWPRLNLTFRQHQSFHPERNIVCFTAARARTHSSRFANAAMERAKPDPYQKTFWVHQELEALIL